MTEQIKSIINSLNASQVGPFVSFSFIILLKWDKEFITNDSALGWRARCNRWNDSPRCCCPHIKQSTEFADVDWWEGMMPLLHSAYYVLVYWRTVLLDLSLTSVSIARPRNSLHVFRSSLAMVLLQIGNWAALSCGWTEMQNRRWCASSSTCWDHIIFFIVLIFVTDDSVIPVYCYVFSSSWYRASFFWEVNFI